MKNLPHFLTLCNLLVGSLGIVFLLKGDLNLAAMMIFAGAVFDFLDGFAARVLNAKSALGKELDSLADMITFGVLPSLILFSLASNLTDSWISYLMLAMPVSAAIRLAKFNLDERQTSYFIGLPTPASALMVASIPFVITEEHISGGINIYTIISIGIILSLLMVSPLKLLSFKFSHYNWKENEAKYILLLLFLILVFYFSFLSIPLVFILYLIFSFFVKFPDHQKQA